MKFKRRKITEGERELKKGLISEEEQPRREEQGTKCRAYGQ